MQFLVELMIYNGKPLIFKFQCDIILSKGDIMSKNYLLIYSEQLATEMELLCQNIKAPSNTLFQIRKSSSSIYANIREANYGQSKSDMISKFEIALKECSESLYWLELLKKVNYKIENIDKLISDCNEIKALLISSINTAKKSN